MFEGLQIALTGIRAGQVGLDTASNNVSNAATPGYTRQRVELATLPPWERPFGDIGMGVDVAGVDRLRDAFADTRVRSAAATAAAADAQASVLSHAEELLGEPDNGIRGALLDVFDAFDELVLDPSSPAVREGVLSALEALAGRIRGTAAAWTELDAATMTEIDTTVGEVNTMLSRIDELNRAVASTASPSNTALDERDLLADKVAQMAGATVEVQADGAYHVMLDGERLVQTPAVPAVRTLSYDAVAGFEVASPATAVTAGGELGGLHAVRAGELASSRADLDQLALDIRDAVNTVNAGGSTPDDPGGASWTDGGPPLLAASGADDFLVVLATGPFDVATAALGGRGLYDATNAHAFADLRTGDPPGLGAPPLEDRIRTLAVGLGNATANANASADTRTALHTSAVAAREARHGVNIDEEMVSLVHHQRALEAATRAMTVIDEALDTIINRTGVVGR